MFIIRMPHFENPKETKQRKECTNEKKKYKKFTTDYQYTSNVMCLYESNFRELLCEIVNPKIQIMHNYFDRSILLWMKAKKKNSKRNC